MTINCEIITLVNLKYELLMLSHSGGTMTAYDSRNLQIFLRQKNKNR